MDYEFQFRKLGRGKARRWLFVLGLVAVTHLLFQSFLLPYGKAHRSLLPKNEVARHVEYGVLAVHSSTTSVTIRNTLTVNASDLIDASISAGLEEDADSFNVEEELVSDKEGLEEISLALPEKGHSAMQDVQNRLLDNDLVSENTGERNAIVTLVNIKSQKSDNLVKKTGDIQQSFAVEQIPGSNMKSSMDNVVMENISLTSGRSDGVSDILIQHSQLALPEGASINVTLLTAPVSSENISLASVSQNDGLVTPATNSSISTIIAPKKMACNMPPKSITTFEEMNQILVRHRAKSRAMRPRWSSPRDQEILAARALIEQAPIVKSDKELHHPIFRNISMFKKSYELMERTLKVYVYKEGEKPIFHQPILKGLYASEGWFMKLMEGNKQYTVKEPRRAHLFYMPFSSRMLEFKVYIRNSHNRTNLRQYLRQYTEKIAAKYRYFNRTGGADHFLVACHDWAPYETRHHMERCMKALCNADVTAGFKIGRDVSLPETYVRSARNPLRDLGGKPASQRHILAFYAGNLHGYLRPILLKHWKDKDPDMKIFGPMPPGVASKMNYIEHMKSSKYCICPKGYEVNSPRVVEAIFYECVPVIISDNFVLPFLEVLNWEAFSLVLAEKDIPNLKDILLSIPNEKYLAMQLAVRKAQKHFLWHSKPEKYDLFHMTLHSIWYNRVFQVKPR